MTEPADLLCAIDVGSNTIKVSLWRLEAEPRWLMSRRFPVRLGANVFETGRIDAERVEAAAEAIAQVKEIAEGEGRPAFRAVATAAVRAASNREALVGAVRERTGIEIEVISEEREARLTAEGMLWCLRPRGRGRFAVIDIGGGSGEITTLEAEGMRILALESRSLRLGAVRLTERHLKSDPPTPEQIAALRRHIDELLREDAGKMPALPGDLEPFDGTVVGCGGTMVSLGWMIRGRDARQPTLALGDMEALLEGMISLSARERSERYPIEPQRAEIIVAGAVALIATMRTLGSETIQVSEGGNREGLLVEHLCA